jgi:hypothetical protein
MKQFLWTLPRNIIGCFKGPMIIWHAIAVLLTLILVTSGLDWRFFTSTRDPIVRSCMFPAVVIGGLLPIALPIILIAVGGLTRSARTSLTGWAVGQSELIGALVAAAYKSVTGRAHPLRDVGEDISHVFCFGVLRGGSSGAGRRLIPPSLSPWPPRCSPSSRSKGGLAVRPSPTLSTSALASLRLSIGFRILQPERSSAR